HFPIPMSTTTDVSYLVITLLLFLLSFPTRRSSDLFLAQTDYYRRNVDDIFIVSLAICSANRGTAKSIAVRALAPVLPPVPRVQTDRKSTRLNSSHVSISYAVFCLKQKIT